MKCIIPSMYYVRKRCLVNIMYVLGYCLGMYYSIPLYVKHDVYIRVMYSVCQIPLLGLTGTKTLAKHKYAGCQGSCCDEDMQAGIRVSTQPPLSWGDEEGDCNPCSEDEECFLGRPDADDMEKAIIQFFMDWRTRNVVALRACTDSF
jgi:hypothetical protein